LRAGSRDSLLVASGVGTAVATAGGAYRAPLLPPFWRAISCSGTEAIRRIV
jgi:hypothetical protein